MMISIFSLRVNCGLECMKGGETKKVSSFLRLVVSNTTMMYVPVPRKGLCCPLDYV